MKKTTNSLLKYWPVILVFANLIFMAGGFYATQMQIFPTLQEIRVDIKNVGKKVYEHDTQIAVCKEKFRSMEEKIEYLHMKKIAKGDKR